MKWELDPVGGAWLVAAAAALLFVLAATRPTPAVSRGRRAVIVALRVAAVLMLLFAMVRPTLVHTRSETLRAALLILVDSSRSMSVEDSLAGRSRWRAGVDMLEESADSLRSLAEEWDVAAYRFDTALTPTRVEDGRVRLPEEPKGDGTELGQALESLLEREAAQRLLGAIVLSDGAQRSATPREVAPQVAARRYAVEGVPIFAFPFGTAAGGDRADVAIDDMVASESVFANTPTQVTGSLRVAGYANQTITVQLLWENEAGEMEVVNAQQIAAGPTGGRFPINLEHTPTVPGEHKVMLRTAPQENEVLTSNNEQATFVTVREGGVKVFYMVGAQRVGGEPGREQRFVRGALSASPDIVVTRRLFDYDPERLDLEDQLANDEYDVYLLEDLDARALDDDSWRALAERVRRGAGLAMLGGYHSFGPGGHADTAMSAVLPITPGRFERQNFGEPLREDVHLEGPVKMVPADPFWRRYPFMQISPTPLETWGELPPLVGANRFDAASLKPNAVVVAEAADTRLPLLVAGQPGSGRALAIAGDSTWLWAMSGHRDAHRRFWRQAVLWLAKKDDSKQNAVWLELDARRVRRGAPLELAVGANPGEDAPDAAVEFDVTVTGPDGATAPVDVSPTERGASGVFRGADTAGDYTVTVTGALAGETLGAATARFAVPDTDLELDQPAAEPAVMSQLAQITAEAGGRALAPEELPDLLAELAAQDPEVREDVVARTTYWDTWPFFLALVGLLCVEWFLRKRWGLV